MDHGGDGGNDLPGSLTTAPEQGSGWVLCHWEAKFWRGSLDIFLPLTAHHRIGQAPANVHFPRGGWTTGQWPLESPAHCRRRYGTKLHACAG